MAFNICIQISNLQVGQIHLYHIGFMYPCLLMLPKNPRFRPMVIAMLKQ